MTESGKDQAVEPLSKIVHSALQDITNGHVSRLPRLAFTALLDDFYYAWLKVFNIPYKYEVLDSARSLFNGQNNIIFRLTGTKSIEETRKKFIKYIRKWHSNDNRVILSLTFDGKRINVEWIEREKYMAQIKEDNPSEKGNSKDPQQRFRVIKGGLSK
jgi:hypothetical protein